MENKVTINIDVEDYIEMLEDRKAYCENAFFWKMPDCVWDYTMDLIRDGILPAEVRPKYLVDNLLVNSHYACYDDVRHNIELENGKIIYETDEELEERLEDETLAFVEDDSGKYVIYQL